MFRCHQIKVKYQDKVALKDFSYTFDLGKLYFIVGPNGSGKSSLLKAMNHLLEYEGEITLDNVNIRKLSHKEKAKKIGYIAQINEVMFPYTIYETVLMGRYPHLKNDFSDYSEVDYKVVDDILSKLNLYDLKDKMITTCSGGELQRVYIARLLAQQSELILVDEITNHLDIKYQIETLELLQRLAQQHQKCVIGVIHDIKMAQSYCDELLVLDKGQLVFHGEPNLLGLNLVSEVYEIEESKLVPYIGR